MEPRRIRRGNGAGSSGARSEPVCFNGAAANSPRKPPRVAAGTATTAHASMEPRRIRRGNVKNGAKDEWVAQLLQWSRGEFAAETKPYVRQSAGDLELQWSRGEFAAETRLYTTDRGDSTRFNGAAANSPRKRRRMELERRAPVGFNGAAANSPRKLARGLEDFFGHGASMEPRRIRRGNAGAAVCGVGAGVASMEPRRIRRGNDWSARSRCGAMSGLQWSRGEFAAETPRPATCRRSRCSSFNGAAANSPRKHRW